MEDDALAPIPISSSDFVEIEKDNSSTPVTDTAPLENVTEEKVTESVFSQACSNETSGCDEKKVPAMVSEYASVKKVSNERKAKIVGALISLSKFNECEEDFDDMFTIGLPKSKSPQKNDALHCSLHEYLDVEIPNIKCIAETSKEKGVEVGTVSTTEKVVTKEATEAIKNQDDQCTETGPSQKKAKKKKKKEKQDDVLVANVKQSEAQSLLSSENLKSSPKGIIELKDETNYEISGVLPASGKGSKKQKNKKHEKEETTHHNKGKNKHKKAFEYKSSTDDDDLPDSRGMGSYSQLLQKMGRPYKGAKQSSSPQKQKPYVYVVGPDESQFTPIQHLMLQNASPSSQSDDSQKQKNSKKNKPQEDKKVKAQSPEFANKKGKKQKDNQKEQNAAIEQQPPCPSFTCEAEMKMRLPKADHKYIVGPGGRHVTEIFQMTGVTIDVPSLKSRNEEITLKGEQLQLGPAVAIMFSKYQQLKMERTQRQGARPKDGTQGQDRGQCSQGQESSYSQGQEMGQHCQPQEKGQYYPGQAQAQGQREQGQGQQSGGKKPHSAQNMQQQQPHLRQHPVFARQNSNRSQDSDSSRGGRGGNAKYQSDMKGQNSLSKGHQQRGAKGQGHLKQKGSDGHQGHQGQGQRCSTPERGQGSTPKSQGKRQRNKKFQFSEYISDKELSDGLKRGQLIQGPIRINPRNFEESYVPHPDGHSDILIESLKDRNRALNGDIVAIQLYDQGEWKLNKDELQSFEDSFQSQLVLDSGLAREEDEDADIVIESEELVEIVTQPNTPPNASSQENNANSPLLDAPSSEKNKKKGDKREPQKKRFTSVNEVMAGGSPIAKRMLGEGGNSTAKRLVQRTGKVVIIIEKKHSRATTGFIKPLQDKGSDKVLFYPNDYRMPRTLIPVSCCPADFHERPQDYHKTLYVCRVTDWRLDSVYADGILAKSLGEAGEIEPETEGMLIENGVDFNEFPQEALDCLPKNLPWSIPAEEFEYRRDYRSACVFTIDPSTARDLDDALSCEDLGNGSYKVGVHIADVSFFLHEGNILDRVAALRSTSVYLVHKVIPMLPRLLCEQLCSLNPDEDRLTFSVEWIITEDGEIEEEWFGRSVIRSCVKLAYEHAQGFIEEPDHEWTAAELPVISANFTVDDIKTRVLNMHKIAVNLRKARHDGGALRLDQVKLQYSLDPESGMPNGYSVYQQKDSNRLVEEFMLLANMAVAHKINANFPDKAFLRRHPPPQEKMIETLKEQCESLGIFIDTSSAGGIQRSLRNYSGDDEFAMARMQVLTALCSKPMQNAVYFCTGCLDDENEYRHYALNVPLYTHFTSPIRRYPDVIVHRLLGATLGYCEPPIESPEKLQRLALHCNDKKTNAKRVGDLSSELFFSVFIKTAGPLEEKAMVMGVLDKAFDIFVLRLGVTKRVYCDKLQLREKIFKKERKVPSLVLVWNTEPGEPVLQQEITIFSVVDCVLQSGDQPLQWVAIIKPPPPRNTDNLICMDE